MTEQGSAQLASAVAAWPEYKRLNPKCTQQEYADHCQINISTLFDHIRGHATAIEDRKQKAGSQNADKNDITAFIQDTVTNYPEEEVLGKNVNHENSVANLAKEWPAFKNNQSLNKMERHIIIVSVISLVDTSVNHFERSMQKGRRTLLWRPLIQVDSRMLRSYN